MIGTETVLTLALYQARSDRRLANELFGQPFFQASLGLNAIQAQIELITDTIFDEEARWELIVVPPKALYFISMSPNTVGIHDLEPWHAAGWQASINVFGDRCEFFPGRRNRVDPLKMPMHVKCTLRSGCSKSH